MACSACSRGQALADLPFDAVDPIHRVAMARLAEGRKPVKVVQVQLPWPVALSIGGIKHRWVSIRGMTSETVDR